MSEQKKSSKQNNGPIIATIVVALLAIAAIVAMIVIMNQPKGAQSSSSEASPAQFRPAAELEQECEYAAHDLVSGNYDVIRLFVTQGLPHLDEPYGNKPEDGVYTVDTDRSGKYKTLDDIEKLVRSIYTSEAAEKIIKKQGGKGIAVFKNRKIIVDAVYDTPAAEGESRPLYAEKTVLGINEKFKADESREKLWESCSLAVLPTSETECDVTVYIGGADTSAESGENIFNTKMIKTDDGWRLTEFIY